MYTSLIARHAESEALRKELHALNNQLAIQKNPQAVLPTFKPEPPPRRVDNAGPPSVAATMKAVNAMAGKMSELNAKIPDLKTEINKKKNEVKTAASTAPEKAERQAPPVTPRPTRSE